MGGTDTRPPVLDGLVRDGELGEVMPDHLGLDLHRVEALTVVDADDAADHLGNDDHVSPVSPDQLGLLAGRGRHLRLAQPLDEIHGLPLQAPVKPPAVSGVEELVELMGGHL